MYKNASNIIVKITLVHSDGRGSYIEEKKLSDWLNDDDGGSTGLEQAFHNAGREYYDDPESGYEFELDSIEYLDASR